MAYLLINKGMLERLSPELRGKLEDILLRNYKKFHEKDNDNRNKDIEFYLLDSKLKPYFLFCPYCKVAGLLFWLDKKSLILDETSYCTSCGESNPFHKIKQGLYKTKKLLNLTNNNDIDEDTKRVLIEQCIVTVISGLEVFLKDFYSTILNIRFIKSGYTLMDFISQEIKNDFLNIGKTKKRFLSDLGINIKQIIGTEEIKKIILMMLKRHIIVHNNGAVDKAFLSQSGLDCHMSRPVPIDTVEVEDILATIEGIVSKFEVIYMEEFNQNLFKEIEIYLKE